MYVDAPLHSLRDRMLALRSLPAFAALGEETIFDVAEHARERRFRVGEELMSPGAPADKFYIVFAGKVVMTHDDRPFMTIEDNGSVGILAVLSGVALGWRAVAERETLSLEIPAPAFYAGLAEDFPLLRNVFRLLASMTLERRGNLPTNLTSVSSEVEIGAFPDHDPTLVERVLALRSGRSLFATANMDALMELCRRMTLLRVPADHRFYEVGDPSAFSLRINAGLVRCTTATGESVVVGREQVIGAMDSFAAQPRSYSARSETPVSAYRTDGEAFLSVLEMHPELALNMMKTMARALIPGG